MHQNTQAVSHQNPLRTNTTISFFEFTFFQPPSLKILRVVWRVELLCTPLETVLFCLFLPVSSFMVLLLLFYKICEFCVTDQAHLLHMDVPLARTWLQFQGFVCFELCSFVSIFFYLQILSVECMYGAERREKQATGRRKGETEYHGV